MKTAPVRHDDAPPDVPAWQPGRRCPKCRKRHRTWYALACCRWAKGLLWVHNDPQPWRSCWALVSDCGHSGYTGATRTVTLWDNAEEAERNKAFIDRLACGGRCTRNHYVVHMVREANLAT